MKGGTGVFGTGTGALGDCVVVGEPLSAPVPSSDSRLGESEAGALLPRTPAFPRPTPLPRASRPHLLITSTPRGGRGAITERESRPPSLAVTGRGSAPVHLHLCLSSLVLLLQTRRDREAASARDQSAARLTCGRFLPPRLCLSDRSRPAQPNDP